ncbi:MAG: AraC family transcriptional regulator [Clostridia bacterium]|jgi:AraC-like DNA-binding protein|nr:AraC family transcriptional regulator [Clostridia bacterium]
MIAKREIWNYSDKGKVWAGKYKNSHNLPHWHYDYELIQVEEGCINVFCDKKKYTLQKDEALLIDSGAVHSMHACTTDTKLRVLIFAQDVLKPFAENIRLASPKFYGTYPVKQLYSAVLRILSEKAPYYTEEAICEIVRFMIGVLRGERVVKRVKSDSASQAFKRLLEEVGNRYDEFTFEDAVSFMGMSDAYFSRYFRAMAGIPFSEYLNIVRTENAIKLLQTEKDISVTEISYRCGFPTIRSFNRIFKEITGYAPKQLPAEFTLEESIPTSDETFNPSLFGCELIEFPS